MHWAIWYHLYKACNFTKSNTRAWMFFTFFKLYKWYQIAQKMTEVLIMKAWNWKMKKQPPRGVPRKRCCENMQQIYKRTLMPNMISVKQITFGHGCSPVSLLHIFRTPLVKNTSGWLLLKMLYLNGWLTYDANSNGARMVNTLGLAKKQFFKCYFNVDDMFSTGYGNLYGLRSCNIYCHYISLLLWE